MAFTLGLPLVLVAVAASLDYAFLSSQQHHLQSTADSAALASAKELALANRTESEIEAVAGHYVDANGLASSGPAGDAPIDVGASVSLEEGSVTVTLSQVWSPFFAHLIDSTANPIVVSSTARVMGSSSVCIVGLMDYRFFASIHLENKAQIDAGGCSVHSNSTSRFSIRLDGQSQMTAESVCSAGGVLRIGKQAMDPDPVTDCPQIDDPLMDRPEPTVGACTDNALEITTPTTLSPGVYCDGLTISADADVTLSPGIYVIKDGPLVVTDTASLTGVDVGFFLTGDQSTFEFDVDTSIDLSAPREGQMAGLLFYEDRDVSHSFNINVLFPDYQPHGVRVHRIKSNDARQLLGTIYLPKSILMIDADAPVADRSAYTALVIARLWLKRGPTLFLNSDYAATEVPLPDALAGGDVSLMN